jgi:PIN domain nuclease of toxin-antitoxin system
VTRRVREAGASYAVTAGAPDGLLLDTHAVIWWVTDSPQLLANAREAIATPGRRVVVSAVSGWEISLKQALGKLHGLPDAPAKLAPELMRLGFETLAISFEHAVRGGALPGPHRDPFDRLLIAQAQCEGLTVVTRDKVFADYGCKTLW